MKFDLIKTCVAIMVSALIAYGLFSINSNQPEWLLPLLSFVEFSVILESALGLSVAWLRSMANVKIVSWLFFIVGLVLNICFANYSCSIPMLIISNGILVLAFILVIYSILKAYK